MNIVSFNDTVQYIANNEINEGVIIRHFRNDNIIVKNKDKEEKIPLKNIVINISKLNQFFNYTQNLELNYDNNIKYTSELEKNIDNIENITFILYIIILFFLIAYLIGVYIIVNSETPHIIYMSQLFASIINKN